MTSKLINVKESSKPTQKIPWGGGGGEFIKLAVSRPLHVPRKITFTF